MSRKKKPPHFDLLGYEPDCEDPFDPLDSLERRQRELDAFAPKRDAPTTGMPMSWRRCCGDCGAPWLMNLDGSTKATACVECGFVISCTLAPKKCAQCGERMGAYREELCNRCQPRPPADPDDVIDTYGEEVSRRKAT